jgi:hypothetical protein
MHEAGENRGASQMMEFRPAEGAKVEPEAPPTLHPSYQTFLDWYKEHNIVNDRHKRKLIADYCGVETLSVCKWGRGKHWPKGVTLIKFWCLLELMGKTVPELEQMAAPVNSVAHFIALNIVSVAAVVNASGLSHNHTLAVLTGRRPSNPKFDDTLIKIIHEHELAYSKLLRDVYLRYDSLLDKSKIKEEAEAFFKTEEQTPQQQPRAEPDPALEDGVKREVRDLANLIRMALPLARDVVSDRFSPADRYALKHLAGEDSVFELSNVMHKLCSERARSGQ